MINERGMNKRGLSNVIVTLIIIVISLIAVGLVWVVVQNLIEGETDEISLGFVTVDLEIKDVKVQGNNTEVKVKRKIGEGEISGLKFIVSDGVNTEVIDKENVNISQLEEKTFILTSVELGNIGFIKEISVAPVFKLGSGEEKIGEVVDKFEFTSKKVIQNLGATSQNLGVVSWWRFEGNARDEIGNNHGTLQGDVNFVEGKFGKAGSFITTSDQIEISDDSSLDIVNEITISAWVYPKSIHNGYAVHPIKKWSSPSDANFVLYYFGNGTGPTGQIVFFANATQSGVYVWKTISEYYPVDLNTWHHVLLSYKSTEGGQLYINGNPVGILRGGGDLITNNVNLYLGRLNGSLDEVMIFNRALTENEVKALYNLDLS